MEWNDEASLEDFWLLLQKEGVVISLAFSSCHVIFTTIFTPCVASQCANTKQSTDGQRTVNRRSPNDRLTLFSFFYEKYYVHSYIL